MIYYNDNDPIAAAWLRWLIEEGLLPDGHVDERSIGDVQPADLVGYTQHHFFAGIGGWPLACRLAGLAADRPIWTASCPCQPFSAAGRREGRDDRRHLWPHLFRLIRAARPAAIVGEQVAGALGEDWFDGVAADLGSEGYQSRAVAIPAAAVDSPQIRTRLYWVAVASAPGERRGQLIEVGGPARRAAASGHDALGVAEVDQGGTGLCSRRPARDGRSELADPDGGLDRAAARRLSIGQLTRWRSRHADGWTHAPRADDRDGRSWWEGADWTLCHDGKARRVADAGAPLLAPGFPGRVAAWRGLGNAICVPQAVEVLKALLETELT